MSLRKAMMMGVLHQHGRYPYMDCLLHVLQNIAAGMVRVLHG